ncbi:hypothetical protein [Terrabacter carboxydivorans]|uniref:DUF4190 domain-containing protein n=1 Tax=Terrabacter carboxydivorans TaxID=619730 RepID=A0ABN3LL58_9MICO
MTDPTPQEGHTSPTPAAVPDRRPTPQPTGQQQPRSSGPGRGLTRARGAMAGAVFAVAVMTVTLTTGVALETGLRALGIGALVAAVAIALRPARAFAQGFLVATVVGYVLAVVVLLTTLAMTAGSQ